MFIDVASLYNVTGPRLKGLRSRAHGLDERDVQFICVSTIIIYAFMFAFYLIFAPIVQRRVPIFLWVLRSVFYTFFGLVSV